MRRQALFLFSCFLIALAAGCANRRSGPQISASNSTVQVTPQSGIVADGTTTALITVTVLDANNNPVVGHPVQVSVSGSNNLAGPVATTDANGVAVIPVS